MRLNRRQISIVCLLTCVMLSAWACASSRWVPCAHRHAIVTTDGQTVPTGQFHRVLNAAVAEIDQREDRDNIILFIHGRGKHPDKAHRQRLLADMEVDYSAKVLMFHWPSWKGLFGFPEAEARAAAPAFRDALIQLQTYRLQHPRRLDGIRFTLLTQSMGSLVLEESVIQSSPATLKNLFDTIVISAPASPTSGHRQWVDPLALSSQLFIMSHSHDPVLGSAELHTRAACLGKSWPSQEQGFAQQAVYLDVTHAWVVHRYYLHRYLKRSPNLQRFYDRVLNGLPAELAPENGIATTETPGVYRLAQNGSI